MLSSLNSFVPVLEGHNFQEWAPAMTSYLMHAGHSKVFKKKSPFDKLCMKYYRKELEGVKEEDQSKIKIPSFASIVDFLEPEEEKEVDDYKETNLLGTFWSN
jgi:hypothetical protein